MVQNYLDKFKTYLIKRKKLIILMLSILLSYIGFMVANEKDVPFVSNIVFGRVKALEAGFNKVCGLPIELKTRNNLSYQMIKGDLKVTSDDYGFIELSNFLIKDLNRNNPRYIENICCGENQETIRGRVLKNGFKWIGYSGMPGNLLGGNVIYGNNSIRGFLSNSESEYVEYYAYYVEKEITTEYRKTAFNAALILLITATLIQIIDFKILKSN